MDKVMLLSACIVCSGIGYLAGELRSNATYADELDACKVQCKAQIEFKHQSMLELKRKCGE